MPGGKGKWSKEEERMISESSQDLSWTTQILFYGNAVTVSALPLCKYWSLGSTVDHHYTLHVM